MGKGPSLDLNPSSHSVQSEADLGAAPAAPAPRGAEGRGGMKPGAEVLWRDRPLQPTKALV